MIDLNRSSFIIKIIAVICIIILLFQRLKYNKPFSFIDLIIISILLITMLLQMKNYTETFENNYNCFNIKDKDDNILRLRYLNGLSINGIQTNEEYPFCVDKNNKVQCALDKNNKFNYPECVTKEKIFDNMITDESDNFKKFNNILAINSNDYYFISLDDKYLAIDTIEDKIYLDKNQPLCNSNVNKPFTCNSYNTYNECTTIIKNIPQRWQINYIRQIETKGIIKFVVVFKGLTECIKDYPDYYIAYESNKNIVYPTVFNGGLNQEFYFTMNDKLTQNNIVLKNGNVFGSLRSLIDDKYLGYNVMTNRLYLYKTSSDVPSVDIFMFQGNKGREGLLCKNINESPTSNIKCCANLILKDGKCAEPGLRIGRYLGTFSSPKDIIKTLISLSSKNMNIYSKTTFNKYDATNWNGNYTSWSTSFSTWQPIFINGISYGKTLDSFIKSSGINGWNANIYSNIGYIQNIYCQSRQSSTNISSIFGLSTNPKSSLGYNSINYGWSFNNQGQIEIFESGINRGNFGIYNANTILLITYDGINVKYFMNGQEKRSVQRQMDNNKLYFNATMYYVNNNDGLIGVKFGQYQGNFNQNSIESFTNNNSNTINGNTLNIIKNPSWATRVNIASCVTPQPSKKYILSFILEDLYLFRYGNVIDTPKFVINFSSNSKFSRDQYQFPPQYSLEFSNNGRNKSIKFFIGYNEFDLTNQMGPVSNTTLYTIVLDVENREIVFYTREKNNNFDKLIESRPIVDGQYYFRCLFYNSKTVEEKINFTKYIGNSSIPVNEYEPNDVDGDIIITSTPTVFNLPLIKLQPPPALTPVPAPTPTPTPVPAPTPTPTPVPVDDCNYKNQNICVLPGYKLSGELCNNGNGNPYNVKALANNYTQQQFIDWLQSLYNRDAGVQGVNNERKAVLEYLNKCKSKPGYEWLSQVSTRPKEYNKCDYKNPNKCILPGYNLSGGMCDNGNGNPYNQNSIVNDSTQQQFINWLQGLYIRDAGVQGVNNERMAVKKYLDACKNEPGFEWLQEVKEIPNIFAKLEPPRPLNLVNVSVNSEGIGTISMKLPAPKDLRNRPIVFAVRPIGPDILYGVDDKYNGQFSLYAQLVLNNNSSLYNVKFLIYDNSNKKLYNVSDMAGNYNNYESVSTKIINDINNISNREAIASQFNTNNELPIKL